MGGVLTSSYFPQARASGLPSSSFFVNRLSPGSVVVDCEIYPDHDRRSSLDPGSAARLLESQAYEADSVLRSGSLTCFITSFVVASVPSRGREAFQDAFSAPAYPPAGHGYGENMPGQYEDGMIPMPMNVPPPGPDQPVRGPSHHPNWPPPPREVLAGIEEQQQQQQQLQQQHQLQHHLQGWVPLLPVPAGAEEPSFDENPWQFAPGFPEEEQRTRQPPPHLPPMPEMVQHQQAWQHHNCEGYDGGAWRPPPRTPLMPEMGQHQRSWQHHNAEVYDGGARQTSDRTDFSAYQDSGMPVSRRAHNPDARHRMRRKSPTRKSKRTDSAVMDGWMDWGAMDDEWGNDGKWERTTRPDAGMQREGHSGKAGHGDRRKPRDEHR